MINKIKCLLYGHRRGKLLNKVYIRDGRRFKYYGRLFKCSRCGTILHIHGILSEELDNLIKTTLKDMPRLENLIFKKVSK